MNGLLGYNGSNLIFRLAIQRIKKKNQKGHFSCIEDGFVYDKQGRRNQFRATGAIYIKKAFWPSRRAFQRSKNFARLRRAKANNAISLQNQRKYKNFKLFQGYLSKHLKIIHFLFKKPIFSLIFLDLTDQNLIKSTFSNCLQKRHCPCLPLC